MALTSTERDRSGDVPAVVRRYFTPDGAAPIGTDVTVRQVFRPETGWQRTGWRKRITPTWARKLRAQGVTAVQLEHRGRRADFQIAELTRRAR